MFNSRVSVCISINPTVIIHLHNSLTILNIRKTRTERRIATEIIDVPVGRVTVREEENVVRHGRGVIGVNG